MLSDDRKGTCAVWALSKPDRRGGSEGTCQRPCQPWGPLGARAGLLLSPWLRMPLAHLSVPGREQDTPGPAGGPPHRLGALGLPDSRSWQGGRSRSSLLPRFLPACCPLPTARRPPPAGPRLLRSCVTTAPSSSRRHPRVLRVASATCNLGAVTSRGWRGHLPRGIGAGALGVPPRRRLTARLLSSLPAGGRGGHGHVHGRGHLQGPAGRRLQEEGGRVHHRGREQRQVLPAHVRTGPHAPGPPQGEPAGRAAPAATRSGGRHGAGGAPGLWAQSQAHGVQGSSGLHQGVPWPLLGCPEGQDTSRHPVLRPTPGATGCVEAALAAVLICLAGRSRPTGGLRLPGSPFWGCSRNWSPCSGRPRVIGSGSSRGCSLGLRTGRAALMVLEAKWAVGRVVHRRTSWSRGAGAGGPGLRTALLCVLQHVAARLWPPRSRRSSRGAGGPCGWILLQMPWRSGPCLGVEGALLLPSHCLAPAVCLAPTACSATPSTDRCAHDG